MEKFYLTLLITGTFFIATCKKDNLDIKIGTLKADINGTSKTFNIQAKASRLSVNGGFGIRLNGLYRTGSTTNLTIDIVSPGQIVPGTYTENINGNPLIVMTHCIEVIAPCVFKSESYKSTTNPVVVTINSITSSSVKGTFKGDLISVGSSNPTHDIFSNGVFYLSF